MATATLSGTPTTIDDATAVTNWGGDTFALNSTDQLEGSSCVECTQTSNGNNDAYVTGTWDFSGTGVGDQHLRLWFLLTYVGNLSTTNPIQVFLYDGTNTSYWYLDKGADYTGGWAQAVIYTGDTPDVDNSVNKASITRIGMRMFTSSKPRNATWNALYDAWKYGDGYTVYGGTSGDAIDFSHIASVDKTSAYGIVSDVDGVYFLRGDIQIGDGTNTTYFEPSGQVAVYVDEQVNTTLYNLAFVDSASGLTNIDISGGSWSSGTLRYTIDASDTNLNSFTIDGLQIANSGLIDFQSSASIKNTSFNNCYQIDPTTCTFENNTISNYVGTAGGALLWAGGTTTKNCNFIYNEKSIEITQTSSQTYDNLKFTSEDNTTHQSTHLNNGGTDINISKNNGSNPLYYTATGGGVVTFVGASVTVKMIAQESDGTKIQNARAFLRTGASGSLPYDATVTIVNASTTATVTHTAHGLITGDKVVISGASLNNNNGVFTITVTGVNAYTYTMASAPGSSPTGTIKCNFVFIEGLTDVNGEISASRVFNADQTCVGTIRKSTSPDFFKPAPISGSVSSSANTTFTGVLISDD